MLNMRRGIVACMAGMGVAMLAAPPVEAANIFDVEFMIVDESDVEVVTGNIAYTDEFMTGVGDEILAPDPSGDLALKGLLSLSFLFDGHAYSLFDDLDYIDGNLNQPQLWFLENEIVGMAFLAISKSDPNELVDILGTQLRGGSSHAVLGAASFADPVARIPSPAAAGAWVALFWGLGLLRRRPATA